MKTRFYLFMLGLVLSNLPLQAQLTLEPALVLRPVYNIYGVGEAGISNIANYQLNRRFSVAAYTSITNHFFTVGRFGGNINTSLTHRLNIKQLVGAGIHFNRKRSVHALFLLGGYAYTSFKEELNNPELDLNQSYAASNGELEAGILYRWVKTIHPKVNFGIRAYVPFHTYLPDFLEMHLGIGVAIRLVKA